jgi:hypothetical protein
VPAGGRQPVHGVRGRAARGIRLDPQRAGAVSQLLGCGARLLPRLGTPLTFRYLAKDRINVTLGSLDDPARARPTKQHGVESRVPWWGDLFELPGMTTADDPPPGGLAELESYQRRDHDA